MAATLKTVVVTGATGAQGGGVVDALLSAGNRKIRAFTRNTASSSAQDLAERGVEVVRADLSDTASLTKAFSDELFLVTDFFAAGIQYEGEFQQGKNAIDAAKEAGIGFVVFSCLEDPPADVKEKLPRLADGHTITHFESKAAVGRSAQVQEYLKKSGLPYTLVTPSLFYENMIKNTMYQKQPDGSFIFSDNMGIAPHAWHSVSTIGLTVAAVLEYPSKYAGKTVPAVGQHISYPTIAEVLSSVTCKTIKYAQMPDEVFASLPIPVAGTLGNMSAYLRLFPYYDDLRPLSGRLVSGPTFKEWAEAHADELKSKVEA
ncbi:NmrA-like family domain-containing protein 1 [Coccomyxa sp. Obi]|nr:NmrA-like family domain-containing protein 1 [Coccomyxa sp. Obi]